MGTAEWAITFDSGFSVEKVSWLILLIIVAVVAVVALYYWSTKRGENPG